MVELQIRFDVLLVIKHFHLCVRYDELNIISAYYTLLDDSKVKDIRIWAHR